MLPIDAARPTRSRGPDEPAIGIKRIEAVPLCTSILLSLVTRSCRGLLCRRKSVERARIVDEDSISRRAVRHPFRQQIEQISVVGHLAAVEVHMRPVGAPNETFGGGPH